MSFFERLENRIRAVDSLLCIGLDPHPADLSEQTASAARDFCLQLIEYTDDLAAAYKPNAAFFEVFGAEGYLALQQVIAAVPDEIPVILDAKRGDIASTASAYARSAFQTLKADAITLNPYLGYDSIKPFIGETENGVFLLCKTSNPGATDLQDLTVVPPLSEHDRDIFPEKLYEQVAYLAQKWNQLNNVGLVVGATQPQSLARVRSLAPDVWILAPGLGAQGGDAALALRAGLRIDGLGMLVPVSRGVSRALDPREAALSIRRELNEQRREVLKREETPAKADSIAARGLADLADGLLEAGCIKFGEFTLKSGLKSPIYIDLRRLVGYPDLLRRVACAYLPILRGLKFERLAALPYAALPITTSISMLGGWSFVYPRKEIKSYGTRVAVEGVYQPGEQVVIIDDLATTGGSKFEGIEKLTAAGLQVSDVVVLIDRQSGASEALAAQGYHMHTVFTLTQLLDYWSARGSVPAELIAATRAFLEQTAAQ